ncbi:stAR-related lipid transfer protein 4-like [Xyrauchen texanus]|uniref:stAR-related lipid transfer protein 4-like n=1 Tax=Xyrauchen texanus TaxID=154827 RepID=UPI0022426D60|nr:stAR-related lipid transfer protein 4-like [Xyrauchen texanus]
MGGQIGEGLLNVALSFSSLKVCSCCASVVNVVKMEGEDNGVSVDHDEHKQGFVRGFNHPCGWFCVPMENSQSILSGYIQTDLRGMLPQSAVDTAMASGLVNFYTDLRRALKV